MNVETPTSLEKAICQASIKALGYAPRENQQFTGHCMLSSSVAELATGEGKTLAAVLPLAFWASHGQGVWLSTANDYLARRDAEWMQPVFDAIGLTVGCIHEGQRATERRNAYACDVTYGTIREFGFDYLRDSLQRRLNGSFASSLSSLQPVQRPPFALVVDEADSLLIDEARTPLVISDLSNPMGDAMEACFRWCARHAEYFSENSDYIRVPETAEIALTDTGKTRLFSLRMPAAMNPLTLTKILHAMERAIYVNHIYHLNHHYLIRDGKVCIIDEYTGRVSEGRTWSDGIHQAIEARENLRLTAPSRTSAQITIQDFARSFQHLSGLTGTAWEARTEFQKVYGLQVQRIASHRPSQRRELTPIVCCTREAKWTAVVTEAQKVLAQGRSVLIGTRCIPASEEISACLNQVGIECAVLNATNPEKEAEIVAQAGVQGRVTVATNMAGRGTDIEITDAVRAAGGLHVIGTELHAARRIDRQLAGRCGRQGDPGSFRQYMAVDDELISAAWGDSTASELRSKWSSTRDFNSLERFFRKAQRVVSNRQQAEREALSRRGESLRELYRQLGYDEILDRCEDSDMS